MKNTTNLVFIMLIFIVSFYTGIFGQADVYFPLHKGDYWQYKLIDGLKDEFYWDRKVESVDTLVEESEDLRLDSAIIYKIVEHSMIYYYKVKVNDNSVVYRRATDNDTSFYPWYKFNVESGTGWYGGDTYNIKFESTGIHFTSWYQIDSIYKFEFGYAGNFVITYHYLMKNIGAYWLDGEFSMSVLMGCIIDGITYGQIVDVEEEPTPNSYELTIQNYPNPFNNQTVIQYSIPESEFVKITMYDMLGREVETLVDEVQTRGKHSIPWQAKGLSSGVYFAVLSYKNKMATQKIIYQK